MQKMTKAQKNLQIKKEAKATLILFFFCMFWHIGFGFGLSGKTDITIAKIPLWWWLSTPGVSVIGLVGVIILLKFVFKNFSLEDDDESEKEVNHAE
ncbi:YhdT family protein [Bacteroides heparinolyticus]|uniref:YhdT family protein n=1 Tax=Prevotella heparinolytica TaxID=28113 RepID=UPI0035A1BAA5